ncbi:hypothetical protein EON63_03425 [archaeon]|nr:MAG: hypothetical protein EON63_03425 [archaeon]
MELLAQLWIYTIAVPISIPILYTYTYTHSNTLIYIHKSHSQSTSLYPCPISYLICTHPYFVQNGSSRAAGQKTRRRLRSRWKDVDAMQHTHPTPCPSH